MNPVFDSVDDEKNHVLGHPAAFFVLFFTEMWERFSFYGMRILLVIFLVSAVDIDGLGWPRANALALYGTYTSLVYLTPIAGGYLADRFMGYRNAVVVGALVMTLGHAAMALETLTPVFLYIGIGLLILGNGLFKPNITSIVSVMYKGHPEKKDGVYTIFYMGINAGSFLGALLCGYLGEKLGWHYGFGLAGTFMFLCTLQFYLARHIFGPVGKKPEPQQRAEKPAQLEFKGDRFNPFTRLDKILMVISTLTGLIWILNDPLSKISGFNMVKIGSTDCANGFILLGLIALLALLIGRIIRYPTRTRDRMWAIALFLLFTTIFWTCFEQAGGTLNIFAKDYTNRIMRGGYALAFNIINTLIILVPCGIITWILFSLFRKTFKNYAASSLCLGLSFAIIWGILLWKLNRDLHTRAYVVRYRAVKTQRIDSQTGRWQIDEKTGEPLFDYRPITQDEVEKTDRQNTVVQQVTLIAYTPLAVGQQIAMIDADKRGDYTLISPGRVAQIRKRAKGLHMGIVKGQVTQIKGREVEIPATWFGVLNALFIIIFSPLFSKWWASRYNPSAATKYAMGLILLGLGFSALVWGSADIGSGAKAASASVIWLVVAYLFHTLGELFLSPVGLSYISKLVPGRMIAMMFGVFFITSAIGSKLAGQLGGMIDQITTAYDMSTFFLLFTLSSIVFGLLALALNSSIKKWMHGVK